MIIDKLPIQEGGLLAGRYRIGERLGAGGMGAVFLAEDRKLPGKKWAVKASVRHSHNLKGFEEEARLLARLEHPFLPKIADFFPPDSHGFSYLIMDYVSGEDLLQKHQRGRLSERQIIRYASQLCELFQYLHNLAPTPVIYRDLKPSNVMIDEQDNVRLIDFGIARCYSSGQSSDTIQLGTIGFAAPEQFENKQTDARTDLYTLGAMMYYLLTGAHPYDKKGWSGERESLLPAGRRLTAVVHRLLEKNPQDRYSSAFDLKVDLDRLLYQTEAGREGNAGGSGSIPRKLIVIGSLYPGAGSTYLSLALCHTLRQLKVAHALVESASVQPELYSLLYGDRYAPKDYKPLVTRVEEGTEGEHIPWRSGLTEWVPLHPDRSPAGWSKEKLYRLLHAVKTDITIVDISTGWEHEEAAELCDRADLVVVVAGPHPGKLGSLSSRELAARLAEQRAEGKALVLAANRDQPFPRRREWLASLPWEPLIRVPEERAGTVLEWQWKGEGIPESYGPSAPWLPAMRPMLEKLLPKDRLERESHKGAGLFKWLSAR